MRRHFFAKKNSARVQDEDDRVLLCLAIGWCWPRPVLVVVVSRFLLEFVHRLALHKCACVNSSVAGRARSDLSCQLNWHDFAQICASFLVKSASVNSSVVSGADSDGTGPVYRRWKEDSKVLFPKNVFFANKKLAKCHSIASSTPRRTSFLLSSPRRFQQVLRKSALKCILCFLISITFIRFLCT
jgi:hypothetical protein